MANNNNNNSNGGNCDNTPNKKSQKSSYRVENYRKRSNNRRSNKNGGSKGRKDYDNSISKVERDMDNYKTKPNDIAWYSKNPQLLKDAASITTSSRTGYKLPVVNDDSSNFTQMYTVPGIMSLMLQLDLPVYGYSSQTADRTDPVNTAAQNQYSFYRHANSGSVNYDAPDLMMANIAAGEAFAALAWGQRAYGTLMLYNQRNRYTPQALLRAQGFDYDACVANMAQFRSYINQIAAKLSVVWLPKTLDFVKRWVWLFSNVYTDSTSAKAQMYLFVPTGFHYFDNTSADTGSKLSFKSINYNSTGITPAQWFTYMNDLINNLITDEDLGIMFGDMLKAYGPSGIYAPSIIDEHYGIVPVHNAEVLAQIMNSTTSSVLGQTYSQTGDGVIYSDAQQVIVNYTPYTAYPILNFWDEYPSPEVVVESTRLTVGNVVIPKDKASTAEMRVISCTEHVVNYRIWYFTKDGTLLWSNFGTCLNNVLSGLTSLLSRISMFDWHPQVWLYNQGPSTAAKPVNSEFTDLMFDVDNYTSISVTTLENLHNVCAMSLFNIPIQV